MVIYFQKASHYRMKIDDEWRETRHSLLTSRTVPSARKNGVSLGSLRSFYYYLSEARWTWNYIIYET